MSQRENEISEEDLFDFIGGNASAEVIKRIAKERRITGSYTDRWFKAMKEELENPFDIDWEALIDPKPPPAMPVDESIDQISEAVKDVQNYVQFEYVDLVSELPLYASAAVRADPLGPYRPALRTAICKNWNWPGQKDNSVFRDEFALTMAVADALTNASLDMPFPVGLVAAILVKEGLDQLCSPGDLA